MRKINLASICLFIFSFAFSQTHVEVKIDTVKVVSGELTIQNATKNVQGFLYNTGNGATSFKRGAIKLNDTTYVIGTDTLRIPRNSSTWQSTLLAGGTLTQRNRIAGGGFHFYWE